MKIFVLILLCLCTAIVSSRITKKKSCQDKPCQNNGTCISQRLNKYICKCQPGYYGRHCQRLHICIRRNPCKNKGKCIIRGPKKYQCRCRRGYYGRRCQRLHICIRRNPCKNKGKCIIRGPNKYQCRCRRGYYGRRCQRLHICIRRNPCKNKGKCIIRGPNRYQCRCRRGYYGRRCQRPHICIRRNPCKNKGKCIIRGRKGYRCQCRPGYYGRLCQRLHICIRRNPCKNKGKCIIKGRYGYKCKCRPGYFGKHCESDRCMCIGSGDPHYFTYDGQMIHFMGICKYTLSTSTAGIYFAVEVKNEHRYGSTSVSYTRMVDVKINNDTIRLLPESKILVNNEDRYSPVDDYPSFSVEQFGSWVTVETPWGLIVRFDGNSIVTVSVPGSYRNKLTGICGDCNGKKDDFRTKDGIDVSMKPNKFSLIGDSYRVPDDSDKPTLKCFIKDFIFNCQKKVVKQCQFMLSSVFKKCISKLGRNIIMKYVESCEIDLCAYLNSTRLEEIYCKALEALAQHCENFGVIVRWRSSTLCPKKCGKNQVYKFDAKKCQPTCANRRPTCTEKGEACVCKAGYILSGKICVKFPKCGCYYRGIYLKPNTVYYFQNCSKVIICRTGGRWFVRKLKPCPKYSAYKKINGTCQCICIKGYVMVKGRCISDLCKCIATSDPHYRTYDNQYIRFMGVCKYIMSESIAGEYFSVQVQNEYRGHVRHVSYTRDVYVKFGNVEIKLAKGKRIFVNGIQRSPPILTQIFSITLSGMWITVTTNWGLVVRFDGRHRVTICVPKRFKNKMIGICGDCNGIKDDLRTKDGQNVTGKPNAYTLVGNSYLVPNDSDKNCNVTGTIPACKKKHVNKCEFIYNSIFKKCIALLGKEQVKEVVKSCEIDVCAYLNSSLLDDVYCKAIESFVQLCEEAGIVVDWRKFVNCPLRCGRNQRYQYDASKCQPTCGVRKTNCTGKEEGCVCDKGYILSGKRCVAVSKCGCFYNGIYLQLNEEYVTVDCRKKIICVAPKKIKIVYLKPCQKNYECKAVNGKNMCVCKKGFVLKYNICFPAGCVIRGDIMIAFDVSNGIGKQNFLRLLAFVRYLINTIYTSDGKSRIGLLAFSNTVFYKIPLGTYINKWRLFFALNLLSRANIYYGNVKTNLHNALAYLTKTFILCSRSYGYCIPKYAFIISYSKSINPLKTRQNAIQLKNLGVKVFSIGIGRNINVNEMRFIASYQRTFFYVPSFGRLYIIVINIHLYLCYDMLLYKPCFYCPYGCYCYPVCIFCYYPRCCRTNRDCKRSEICFKGECKTRLQIQNMKRDCMRCRKWRCFPKPWNYGYYSVAYPCCHSCGYLYPFVYWKSKGGKNVKPYLKPKGNYPP